jgi:hypothetical protein
LKKIKELFFNKDDLLSSFIAGSFWTIFIMLGGYILFITSIQPWWIKLVLVGILAVVLFLLCGKTDRTIFKKLGRKSPKDYG